MFGLPPVAWQLILLSPLGLTLSFLSMFLFIFLFMLIMRTPAMTFLKASFGKKMILINPGEDKRMNFRIAKKDRSMAYVKNLGYYIVDPNHVHIESVSKIPVAITYGNFGISIDPKVAQLTQKLKDIGITNWTGIVNQVTDNISSSVALKRNLISKEEHESDPSKTYTIPKEEFINMQINGESLPFDNIPQYFSYNPRSDLIESEIQWRTSSQVMAKLNQPGNMLKYAVILVIILIGGALAYTMVTMGKTDQVPQVGGYVQSGVQAVTGGAINGTGLV